jgi:hypothetical protein
VRIDGILMLKLAVGDPVFGEHAHSLRGELVVKECVLVIGA